MLTERKIYTVSELTRNVKRMMEDTFASVWLSGEVSNYVKHSSGHMYMTLKDDQAQIRLVIFAGVNRRLKFDIKNGMDILVGGPLTIYERSGQYQIMGQHVEPKGLGALQLAYEQLKEKLELEGLFDAECKQPLPPYPKTIGVITSPTGAAIRDILQVLRRRYPLANVIVSPVRVQGEGAAQEISDAIDRSNAYEDIDVLIVGRGGGSIEDLWAFNEEKVVRSIAASNIPIVSAVGHEIDFTIADFVADVRAATPSAAAELVVPNMMDLQERIASYHLRVVQSMKYYLDHKRQKLTYLQYHYVFKESMGMTRQFQQRIDDLQWRMQTNGTHRLNRSRDRLAALVHRLQILNPRTQLNRHVDRLESNVKRMTLAMARVVQSSRVQLQRHNEKMLVLNPMNILSRGYSIAIDEGSNDVIKSVQPLLQGMSLKTRFSDGVVYSTIDKIEVNHGA